MTMRIVLLVAALLTACTMAPSRGGDLVRLQLKWVPQAQFAGYYVAKDQGFYREEGLDVTLLPGGPDLVPEDVIARGGAHVGITWLPALLAARERGLPLVNIAQVFAHSGLRQLALTKSGIRGVGDLRGRRVAVWPGHEAPLLAALYKNGIAPGQITLVHQGLGMQAFVDGQVDSAGAMTYNELRQVWQAGVTTEQLVVMDLNREGTATLEDGLFVRADWLRSPDNVRRAGRFLRASLRGFAFCRDRAADCLAALERAVPNLDRAHQTWMLTEITKLIYGPPTPTVPTGRMDPASFARTASVLLANGLLDRPAEPAAYTDVVWHEAQGR